MQPAVPARELVLGNCDGVSYQPLPFDNGSGRP